uniref:Uncharacterized protein n=1 Tax=Spermophilus dauricus TaxID=99837 RepID=A0A8C9PD24_SPEDA
LRPLVPDCREAASWAAVARRAQATSATQLLFRGPQAPSMTGQPGPGHGKKLGHRGVDASGETTYKKVRSYSSWWAGWEHAVPRPSVSTLAHGSGVGVIPGCGPGKGWA